MVPDEQPMPTSLFSPPGEIGDRLRVGKVTEVRNRDSETHRHHACTRLGPVSGVLELGPPRVEARNCLALPVVSLFARPGFDRFRSRSIFLCVVVTWLSSWLLVISCAERCRKGSAMAGMR